MIYLVTNAPELFESSLYKRITVDESLQLLDSLEEIALDTETEGLDPYIHKLLSLQLGCYEFQIVIDCLTINISLYKSYLESNRTFLGWNLKFDLKFLFKHQIILKNVYDGFLAEKLMWLGYPAGIHSMSLKAAGEKYCNIELDKSIRGQIIYKGLTEDTIVYAATDVKYLHLIRDAQRIELAKKGLLTAIKYENAFVIPLAYTEYCGIKLDKKKWQEKMKKDQERLDTAKCKLDNWFLKNLPTSKYIKRNFQGDLFNGYNTDPIVTVNWNSPVQLIPIFKSLGIDLESQDKESGQKKDSLDAKILGPQKNKCDLIPIYLDYREAQKLVSTYGENFLKQINPVSGRIHTNYQQLGADTTRITSGGKDKNSKTEYVNLLNLPSDEETRSCFVAEEGNKWISIDYSGQETYLMASIANDKAIIKELTEGSGDIHSLTAYMAYQEIPRDTPIKDIKKLYHNLRQEAKGIEFAINYGGNADTISINKGIPREEAAVIYNNYMKGFSGLKAYQDFRRKDWWDKGYILLSPKTGHKAFIYDYEDLKRDFASFQESGFWDHYRDMKKSDPSSYTVQKVKHFFKRKAASEKQSINYCIQAAGSLCLRTSMIKFWKYLLKHDLVFKVLICVTPYDEINCEAPAEIADEIAKVLYNCMVEAGAFFCTRCKLDADISYDKDGKLPTYWIH